MPFRLPRAMIQNHHLIELASRMYATTAIQKAFALTNGIKMKTPMIEVIAIIIEIKNQKCRRITMPYLPLPPAPATLPQTR
jgi:hypothetical protein